MSKTEPVEEVRWSWKGLVAGLRGGLFYGLVAGLLLGLVYGLVFGWADGRLLGALVGALLFGPIGALVFGLVGGLAVALTNERSTPNEGIHRSARHALFFGLVLGLVGGLFSGLPSGQPNRPAVGLAAGLLWALLFGLGFGGLPCLRHIALRALLAYNGFAPLRYVRFLDEATDRLFLRRAQSDRQSRGMRITRRDIRRSSSIAKWLASRVRCHVWQDSGRTDQCQGVNGHVSADPADRARPVWDEEGLQAQQRHGPGWAPRCPARSLRDVGRARQAQHADRQVAQRGHHPRAGSGADLRPVLVERDVTNPVEAVLDAPMVTRQTQQTGRVRFLRRQAGQPVDGLAGAG